jgi:hypothetical protein
MTIQSSPLLGYNNNIPHRGKVFHIQTEDSGARYGHIMTHLFTDGGRILKSVKTSYSEYVGGERMAEIVREMMKQQHKAMIIALRAGKFDGMVDAAVEAQPASRSFADAASPPGAKGGPPPRADAQGAPRIVTPATPAVAEEPEELTLDVDVLERAAAAADVGSPVGRTPSDLPPPPASLLREKTGGSAVLVPSVPSRKAPSGATGERRYAPTRPASIFGQARPQQGKSIFGEDLMSDKSLDEVILSYLGDDLEGDKKP